MKNEADGNGIVFDETAHAYSDRDGNAYASVTQLLHEMGLAPDYSGIDEETLKRAAKRGEETHERIERALKDGKAIPETAPLDGYELIDCERVVSDGSARIAGRYDLKMRRKADDRLCIIDIKCTATPPVDYCAWQASVYRKLDGLSPELCDCLMLHVPPKNGGASRLIGLFAHPDGEIDRLFRAFRNSEPFRPDPIRLECLSDPNLPDAVRDLAGKLDACLALAEALKKNEADVEAVKRRIYEEMRRRNIPSIALGSLRLTAVAPSVAHTLDAARLKVEMPMIAAKYEKTSQRAGYLKVAREKAEAAE